MTEYHEAASFYKPEEFDTTSSAVVVYQRRNIQLVNDFGKQYWLYEEREMTKDEYSRIREAELEDELTQTQLALAELYESMVVQNG